MKFWYCTVFIAIYSCTLCSLAMARSNQFGGNKVCQECHKEIFASWKESLHAKSFDVLKPGARAEAKIKAGLKPEVDFSADKSCVKCHALGFEKGGYSMESPDPQWEGNGCETCHGAAEKYFLLHLQPDLEKRDRRLKQAGLIKPYKGVTVCARCHDDPDSPVGETDSGVDWTDPQYAKTFHILK